MLSMDIKNTLEAIELAATLAKTIDAARADGKVDLNDLGLLMGIMPKLGPALDDITQIPAEIRDLDADELNLIREKIIETVGAVSSERVERIANSSLGLAIALHDLITAIRD